MEALNKAYGGKGISFYWILSREPHPGFYGFTQTDSLEMRKEYVRLADAELRLDIPWIIDQMENPMQRTYGGMPNAEFIVDSDGTLLYKNEWADPDSLKAFLEERFGPSDITDEEWERLGAADPSNMAIGNNDEVPATEVPLPDLHDLTVKPVKDGGGDAPFDFSVKTLPPNITPQGQSRLYLFVDPDDDREVVFDKSEPITIELSGIMGVEPIKTSLKAGSMRRGEDNITHTLGVLWTLKDGAARMSFKAEVAALVKEGGAEPRKVSAVYRVEGAVPESPTISDEIASEKLAGMSGIGDLECTGTSEQTVPMDVEAKFVRGEAGTKEGTAYIVLKVAGQTGHKWNNLSAPPSVRLKPVSGLLLDKTILNAGKHPGDGDAEDRVLAVKFILEPGATEFAFEATPEVWICNDDLGWCRIFTKTYRIAGKVDDR